MAVLDRDVVLTLEMQRALRYVGGWRAGVFSSATCFISEEMLCQGLFLLPVLQSFLFGFTPENSIQPDHDQNRPKNPAEINKDYHENQLLWAELKPLSDWKDYFSGR